MFVVDLAGPYLTVSVLVSVYTVHAVPGRLSGVGLGGIVKWRTWAAGKSHLL